MHSHVHLGGQYSLEYSDSNDIQNSVKYSSALFSSCIVIAG